MKKLTKLYPLMPVLFAATPLVAAAAVTDLASLVAKIIAIVNTVLPAIMAIAALVFVWGIAQYVMSAGNEEARKTGQQKIMYGLIGLFILVSFWGILAIITKTFDLGTATVPTIPTLPTTAP